MPDKKNIKDLKIDNTEKILFHFVFLEVIILNFGMKIEVI